MIARGAFRLPDEQEKALVRAWRLEWIWLGVLLSITVAIYFALGNSQAMKTAWIEDLLSFVPPIAFLVATAVERREPNDRFPLGYIRVTSIAYLIAAVSIAAVGLFLIYDAAMVLIRQEHPTIGTVEIFGVTFWFGWLMIAALVYSVVPPVVFGRLKMRQARPLHDKVLWADAVMNKADWMTGLAAVVGVIGIGFGFWWADAVAALLIALDVLHDGFEHTRAAIHDLMDRVPRTIDDKETDPIQTCVKEVAEALPWVETVSVRLREEGRFLAGVVYVTPRSDTVDAQWVTEGEQKLRDAHWRLLRISLVPVADLERAEGE